MATPVQDVIRQIQNDIVSSYTKYRTSSQPNSNEKKTFQGFLEQSSGEYFLPWAEQYKDSLKEQEQPTIEGFLTFCSREFFLSRGFLDSEGNSGRIGAYRGAVAVASEQGETIKPDFQGFLKFLCSGSVVSAKTFLTFRDVANAHRRQLKSPILRQGGEIYDETLSSIAETLKQEIQVPLNLLQKDTPESGVLNRMLKKAFNSACRQADLLKGDLSEDVEITADHIKLPNNPTGSGLDVVLLDLDDRITDAWRFAAIMVLEALDDSFRELNNTSEGELITSEGELIVTEVQAKCITGFLTVDLLTGPIGKRERDALREEIATATNFSYFLKASPEELTAAGEYLRSGPTH
jgi:hypothetical protein